MNYLDRKQTYEKIEKERDSKVLSFATGTRPGLEIHIASDCIPPFTELLEQMGPTKRISLILHTNGGDILVARQLVNLIRMFCEYLEVIVPTRAMSAGTIISIGSDQIVMTKHATLGPIDPSIRIPLNPVIDSGENEDYLLISVENVWGYLDMARKELKIRGKEETPAILQNLTNHIHPVVLGEIYRSRTQIRSIAEQLLLQQVKDEEKRQSIIDFLCSDSGSHDYTIDSREANQRGLNAEVAVNSLSALLRKIEDSFVGELHLFTPFFYPDTLLDHADAEGSYSLSRGLIEGTSGLAYRFTSDGTVDTIKSLDMSEGETTINNRPTFEGWKRHRV